MCRSVASRRPLRLSIVVIVTRAQEMTWRFNRGDMKPSPRMNELFCGIEGRLTYKVLIA
jgi:hypothetical protein